jgi:tetratricopeptide (TPR) repeat protein
VSLLLLVIALQAAPQAAPPEVERALQSAAALEEAGRPSDAILLYRSAIDQAPPNSAGAARLLYALAGVEVSVGRNTDARAHARQAAAAFAQVGDPAREGMAHARAGSAALYAGEYADARVSFEAAIRMSTQAGHDEGRAEGLGNLGNVHFYVGRYAEAARAYDQALAVVGTAGAQPWTARRRRLLLVNKATLYQRLGMDQRALELYTALGPDNASLPPGEQGQILANLGVLYRRLGDPVKAIETYDAALALFARARHLSAELNVMKNRGIALALDLGKLAEAEATFSRALDSATRAGNRREMLHAALYRAETRRRAGRGEAARDDFQTALSLARELSTPEEEWKALYGLGRTAAAQARVQLLEQSVAVIEKLREGIRVPALRSDFFNDKREVYDALIAARVGSATPAEVFRLIEGSHSRAWRDRLELSGTLDLAAVQRALGPRVLLLDFWHADEGSALVAVTRARSAVLRPRVTTMEIDAVASALAGGAGADWRSTSRPLAALLPDEAWLRDVDHIVVVPDGALALVPFEIVPSGDRLLIERAAVSYTPTAATLLRAPSQAARVLPPWAVQLRAFADPLAAPASGETLAPARERLARSAEEVRAVARELGGRAELHIGADNRKEFLLTRGTPAPLLHLATHAMADADAMERSHIVFSGAAESEGGDVLFLKEAYDLPLDGVELAVLSACDTARGRLLRGEGIQSFSHAFLAAGARSTVTTLWRVPDAMTAGFMEVFYHHLRRGVARDEALRRTKLRFLHSGSPYDDPHLWAAFVLTGDGLGAVPWAVTWTLVAAGLLAVAVTVLLAAMWRRSRRSARAPVSPGVSTIPR